jgi:hypothetical protein
LGPNSPRGISGAARNSARCSTPRSSRPDARRVPARPSGSARRTGPLKRYCDSQCVIQHAGHADNECRLFIPEHSGATSFGLSVPRHPASMLDRIANAARWPWGAKIIRPGTQGLSGRPRGHRASEKRFGRAMFGSRQPARIWPADQPIHRLRAERLTMASRNRAAEKSAKSSAGASGRFAGLQGDFPCSLVPLGCNGRPAP